jgi:hypothetical protein
MTESISRSEAPDRINGATEVGKSMPPASPQAATVPPSACHRQNSAKQARAEGVDTVSSARICQWFRGSGGLLAMRRSRSPSGFFQVVDLLRTAGRGCDLKATPRENCSCERVDGPGDENRRRGGCDPAADFGSTAA